MAVKVYYSSDAGAPVLCAANSNLITVLYTCLVSGYGSLSGLGWSNTLTNNNTTVFYSNTGANAKLFINDNSPSSNRFARIRAYESVNIDTTGNPINTVNPFPTSLQAVNGLFYYKASEYGTFTNNHPWVLIGDEKGFYFGCDSYTNGTNYSGGKNWMYFGEILSFRANDSFPTLLIAGTSENATPSNPSLYTSFHTIASSPATDTAGHYMQRNFDLLSPSVGASKVGATWAGFGYSGGAPYPHPVDDSLLVTSVLIGGTTPSDHFRGILPGIYAPQHIRPVTEFTNIVNVVGLSNRTLQAFTISTASGAYGASVQGVVMFDITGPWR